MLPLADETVVLPGHGPATTIGRERRDQPVPAGPAARRRRRGACRCRPRRARTTSSPAASSARPRPSATALLAPARLAGYAYVETPVFEHTDLFARGVGESTDVVTKEMFTFHDRADRSLTLRPEGTVGVLRAVLDAGLHKGQLPVKLRYAGPMFRAERPQAGRYRQFQQVGVEALGLDDPALDAEVVALAAHAFARPRA